MRRHDPRPIQAAASVAALPLRRPRATTAAPTIRAGESSRDVGRAGKRLIEPRSEAGSPRVGGNLGGLWALGAGTDTRWRSPSFWSWLACSSSEQPQGAPTVMGGFARVRRSALRRPAARDGPCSRAPHWRSSSARPRCGTVGSCLRSVGPLTARAARSDLRRRAPVTTPLIKVLRGPVEPEEGRRVNAGMPASWTRAHVTAGRRARASGHSRLARRGTRRRGGARRSRLDRRGWSGARNSASRRRSHSCSGGNSPRTTGLATPRSRRRTIGLPASRSPAIAHQSPGAVPRRRGSRAGPQRWTRS
jgi:hypothetical protein